MLFLSDVKQKKITDRQVEWKIKYKGRSRSSIINKSSTNTSWGIKRIGVDGYDHWVNSTDRSVIARGKQIDTSFCALFQITSILYIYQIL